jgi:hypothetical protein
LAQDDLVKDLVAVQIHRAAADLAAKDGDAPFSAKGDIDLLLQVLMIADADVRLAGSQDVEPLDADAGLGVVHKL